MKKKCERSEELRLDNLHQNRTSSQTLSAEPKLRVEVKNKAVDMATLVKICKSAERKTLLTSNIF